MRAATAGWIGIAVVVAAADGHALDTGTETMSGAAGRHPIVTAVVGGYVLAHLLLPGRLHHLDPARRASTTIARRLR